MSGGGDVLGVVMTWSGGRGGNLVRGWRSWSGGGDVSRPPQGWTTSPLWSCDLSHDAFGVTPPPPIVGQTDTCEIITFARFATRAVMYNRTWCDVSASVVFWTTLRNVDNGTWDFRHHHHHHLQLYHSVTDINSKFCLCKLAFHWTSILADKFASKAIFTEVKLTEGKKGFRFFLVRCTPTLVRLWLVLCLTR